MQSDSLMPAANALEKVGRRVQDPAAEDTGRSICQ